MKLTDCPACSEPVSADDTFCRTCGHRLHAASNPVAPSPPGSVPRPASLPLPAPGHCPHSKAMLWGMAASSGIVVGGGLLDVTFGAGWGRLSWYLAYHFAWSHSGISHLFVFLPALLAAAAVMGFVQTSRAILEGDPSRQGCPHSRRLILIAALSAATALAVRILFYVPAVAEGRIIPESVIRSQIFWWIMLGIELTCAILSTFQALRRIPGRRPPDIPS